MDAPLKPGLLIVDDDAGTRILLRRAFETHFEVGEAEDAWQALAALREGSYDVVVSDYWMPGIPGTWLLEQVAVRSPQSLRVLMTSDPDQECQRLLRSGVVHDLAAKPLSAIGMRQRILALIVGQRSSAVC